MNVRKIFITSAQQISMQQPLCHQWMVEPLSSTEPYVRSCEPNYREFLSPIESRRLGKVLKRALVTSLKVMSDSGVTNPDAIITGTGLGCVENTESFLKALCIDGEQLLKPTHFMQSTHNTIGSLIAIHTKSHGYNVTYSDKATSFESALYDALLQFAVTPIKNALVGSHDEVTPSYFTLLKRIGYVGQPGQVACSEASVAMMLQADVATGAWCEVEKMEMLYSPQPDELEAALCGIVAEAQPDAIVAGINNAPANDCGYSKIASLELPIVAYKRAFGENYSASALGVYAAARMIKENRIPQYLLAKGDMPDKVERLLVFNHSDNKNYSLLLLKKCGL